MEKGQEMRANACSERSLQGNGAPFPYAFASW